MTNSLSDAAHAFLKETRFAVLATINPDSTPQQSTVWYDLDGDEILMNTKRGRLKDRNMRRDPRVSFCIEAEYAYLTIRGRVTLIDDQTVAQPDIERLATRYHGPERAQEQMREQFSTEERVTVRMRMERIKEYALGR